MNSYYVLCSVYFGDPMENQKEICPHIVNYQRERTCVGSSETRQPLAETWTAMRVSWLNDPRKSF